MRNYLDFSLSLGASLEERPRLSSEASSAVEAFLAERKPRRFEMGASTSFDMLSIYLAKKGVKVEMLAGSNRYRINGRKCKFADVLALADKYRIKDGLSPLRRGVA